VDYRLNITCPEDPITYSWQGGVKLAQDDVAMKKLLVTRQEYLEHGSTWLLRRFESTGD
jgi:actin-related protein 6